MLSMQHIHVAMIEDDDDDGASDDMSESDTN
jgi:hypothetical protein